MCLIFISGVAAGCLIRQWTEMLSGAGNGLKLAVASETITAVIFVLVYLKYGLGILFLKWVVFLSVMILTGILDFVTGEVYLITIIPAMLAAIFFMVADSCLNAVPPYLYGAGGIAALLIISVIIVFTNGMGWGDAEVFFIFGLFLGIEKTILLIFLSFILGGAAGIILLLLNPAARKMKMPFVPFIASAALINVLFGNEIIQWYINLV